MIYDTVKTEQFTKSSETIEDQSKLIDDIVKGIIEPYVHDLDDFVTKVSNGLNDLNNPVTTAELDLICMRLSTYIYFASSMAEHLGIREDISKAVYKEVYNNHRNLQETGTVADKNTMAELKSQQEQIVSICYSRAYKIVKSKVDNAQELLGSCKKVLSHRISEMELTRISKG